MKSEDQGELVHDQESEHQLEQAAGSEDVSGQFKDAEHQVL